MSTNAEASRIIRTVVSRSLSVKIFVSRLPGSSRDNCGVGFDEATESIVFTPAEQRGYHEFRTVPVTLGEARARQETRQFACRIGERAFSPELSFSLAPATLLRLSRGPVAENSHSPDPLVHTIARPPFSLFSAPNRTQVSLRIIETR